MEISEESGANPYRTTTMQYKPTREVGGDLEVNKPAISKVSKIRQVLNEQKISKNS